jgi:hypothetical protein
MQFTITALASLAAFAASASATVSYGTFQGYDVAWIDDWYCDGTGITFITPQGNNPCGIPFTLSNGFTYTLEGCGTSEFALYNGDGFGSYNAKCNYNYWSVACECGIAPDGDGECGDYMTQSWLC